MNWNSREVIEALKQHNKLSLISLGNHGVEREGLRVQRDGNLALTPHPKVLGDPFTNTSITTDFSESQLELITKPFDSIDSALKNLYSIHQEVFRGLGDERMWPFSMPCMLPEESQIPIAYYGESEAAQQKVIYRRGLAERYGKFMQLLCGIHYNFSFSDQLWQFLHEQFGGTLSLQEFKNQRYLGLVRNFIRYRWLLVYLLAATPMKHLTYGCKGLARYEVCQAISLRSSRCGYDNPAHVQVSYNAFQQHLSDLEYAMSTPYPRYTEIGLERDGERIQLNDHLLQIANEYYFPIRMKPKPSEQGFFAGLQTTGCEYLEVRLLDVDPLVPQGIDTKQLHLTHVFLLWCFLEQSDALSDDELARASDKQQFVAVHGRQMLPDEYHQEGQNILKQLEHFAQYFSDDYHDTINFFVQEFDNPRQLMWQVILSELNEYNGDYIRYGLALAERHYNTLMNG